MNKRAVIGGMVAMTMAASFVAGCARPESPRMLAVPLELGELPDQGRFEVTFDENVVQLNGISAGWIGSREYAVEAEDLGPGHVLVEFEVGEVRGDQESALYFRVVGDGEPNVEVCDLMEGK